MRYVIRFLVSVLALTASAEAASAGTVVGKVESTPVKFRENAVIYVDKIEGKESKPSAQPAEMDQRNLTFVPHVLPIVAGTTVRFRNSDDVLHNVFSPDKCAEKFNLGSWPKGETRDYTFRNLGCVPVLLCNVHPEMEAFIVILQNPYFAVSDKEGGFTIQDVPAGKYILKVWHEKLKGEPQEIVVAEKDTIEVRFNLKR